MGAQDSRPEPRRSRASNLQRYGNDDNGLFHCFTGKDDSRTLNRISYNNPNNKTGITCFSGPVDPGENRSNRSPLTPRQKKELERKSLANGQAFNCCGGTKRQLMESGGSRIRNSNALELKRTYEEAVSITSTPDISKNTGLTHFKD